MWKKKISNICRIARETISYLSHHMFPIDKGFEPADCRTLPQWEDVLGLDGHSALVGVLLENDDLLGGEARPWRERRKPSPTTPLRKRWVSFPTWESRSISLHLTWTAWRGSCWPALSRSPAVTSSSGFVTVSKPFTSSQITARAKITHEEPDWKNVISLPPLATRAERSEKFSEFISPLPKGRQNVERDLTNARPIGPGQICSYQPGS